MTKMKFLRSLHDKLSGLPSAEVEERLNFYSEMIEDRMEEGLSEEEAVAEIGEVDEIAEQIAGDIPLSKIAKEKLKPTRKMKAWEIILIALGSPIWLSLLVTVASVVISLYAVLWSLVATVWAVFAAFSGAAVGGVAVGIIYICTGSLLQGIALIGAALVCGGISIFCFLGSLGATKGAVLLTQKIDLGIKKCFIKKEERS